MWPDGSYPTPDPDYATARTGPTLHAVRHHEVVWYGGMGHRFLSIDDGGSECFRCGDAFDGGAWQECVADCEGPDRESDPHYWMGAHNVRTGEYLNKCAACSARTPAYA